MCRKEATRASRFAPPAGVGACRRRFFHRSAVVARGVESFGGLEFPAARRVPNGASAQHRIASRAGLRRAPLVGGRCFAGGGWTSQISATPVDLLFPHVERCAAASGRPWWQGAAASLRFSSLAGAQILCGVAVAGCTRPPLCLTVVVWAVWGSASPGLLLRRLPLGSFSPVAYGGMFRCPDRTQWCRTPLPLLRHGRAWAWRPRRNLGGYAPGPDRVLF
jgi:hypothetical protein